MNRPCISHGYRDTELQRYLGHDLDLSGSRTSSLTWPLDSQYGVSYRWSIRTDRLSRTAFEILSFKVIGVMTLTFRVTWRHRSCDHRIPNVWFPIGSKYELTMYLARFSTYWASKISGSRPWPFGVTWRHLSRDHWIRNMGFPIGGQLPPTVYLARFLRYSASNVTTLTFRRSAHVKGQKVDCACLVSRDLLVGGQKQLHIWIHKPNLPIHYDTFRGLRWRIRGVYLWDRLC